MAPRAKSTLVRSGAALAACAAACAAVPALSADGVAPRAEAASAKTEGGAAAPRTSAPRAAVLRQRGVVRRRRVPRRRGVARRRARRADAEVRPAARFALDGPRGTLVRRNVYYSGLGFDDPRLDVYRRAGRLAPAPAVLLVHGGGWTGGGKRRMAPYALDLARAGLVVVNVGYTLAEPGRPGLPRQADQLRAAVGWIRRHADRLGVDPERIGAFGSSAGGHLATLVATEGSGPTSEGTRLGATVAWSPPLDLAGLSGHLMLGGAARTLIGCGPFTCPDRWAAASPVTHVSADDPPLLIVNSRREMVPASQSVAMAERLAAAGVPHELWLLDGTRHARDYASTALDRTVAFLRRELLQ